LAVSTSRLEVSALLKNAFPAGNARKGALSRQFTNMMSSLLSITPNAMYAAIATRSAHPVPLKSLSMTPKIKPELTRRFHLIAWAEPFLKFFRF
jgi:hypothetical protein